MAGKLSRYIVRRQSAKRPSLLETLEPRQLLSSAPVVKFGTPTFYFNDIESSASGGSGSSPSQSLQIRNAGNATLTVNSLSLGGTNSSEFTVSTKGPITISAGSSKTVSLAFNAKALGVQTATLTVKTNDSKHATTTINLRGLGTAGTGGSLEPSLQRILDLFQIPDKVGEPNPDQTAFPLPPATPNNEVQAQTMTKAGSGSVTIQLLAVFDNFKTPATEVGTYTPGSASSAKQLFSVPNQSDAQSVHPTISGSTSFDPGTKSFGIYTVFPAFSNRKSFSEDALNTWELISSRQKKIRFYPLKNPDGSTVANAYVFAAEDYNKAFDYNDVVGIIRNVKPGNPSVTGGSSGPSASSTGVSTSVGSGGAIGSSGGVGSIGNISGLKETNQDVLPGNDRLVFNRIENPDPIRPNVTHDSGDLRLTNTSGSAITIDSISIAGSGDFKITSGGGSNITLAAGASRDINITFVGTATGSTILKVFNTTLKISSGGKTDTVILDGLWQENSEKLTSGKYDEPSLATVINTIFGYETTIIASGQTTNHGGKPGLVGDEVGSAYWTQVDPSQPVKVRMLADFHRQNNFDAVTDAPEPANSEFSYYIKGASSSKKFVFKENVNEGQSLLPHIDNSTTSPAQGSFSPGAGKVFGFEADKHFTDQSLNALDFNPTTNVTIPNTGYSWRIFPLKDENGNVVPNTYIAAMDYTANKFANWDYNDNIYLISNIKPVSTTTTTMSLAAPSATSSLFSAAAVEKTTALDQTDPGQSDVL